LTTDAAKALPVVRGDGVDQIGVDRALNVLNDDGWVHLFVEGKVNQLAEMLQPIRWGVGKLALQARRSPTVLPIHIDGFDKMFPEMDDDVQGVRRYWRRLPRRVDVAVAIGQPFHCDDARQRYRDIVGDALDRRAHPIDVSRATWLKRDSSDAERAVYSDVAAMIADKMLQLEQQHPMK
jgi:hypothetical protein